MEGWIKLHRSLLDWEWWDDPPTLKLYLYLLIKANHKEKKWRGQVVKPGQLVTGVHKLSECTKLSVQQVRTALKKLKSTNNLTSKSTNRFSLITISGWEKHQCDHAEATSKSTSQLTNKQQTNNKQITTNKNVKNVKNPFKEKINKKKENKKQYLDGVLMTEEEHQSLVDRFGESSARKMIENLNNYILSTGKKYKSHYHTLLVWASKDNPISGGGATSKSVEEVAKNLYNF